MSVVDVLRGELARRYRDGTAQVSQPRVISWISSKDSSPVVSALLDLDEYGLLEAADGQAALEVVRDERPDLVILALHDGPSYDGPPHDGGLWTAWRAPFPESATLPLRGG